MANSIALASRYLPKLDAVYKRDSLTARFDSGEDRVKFLNSKIAYVFKTQLDGLGDYSRNNGYVKGSVTSTWEPLTVDYDRGREFQVDTMDNEETIDMAFGTTAGVLMREHTIPETDAARFAKYAISAGNTVNADLSTAASTLAAIDTAEEALGDLEVPGEGRILFVSEATYKLIKGGITRMLKNEGNVNRNVESFDEMEVVRVPKTRFNVDPTITGKGIDLYDGTTSGEEAGGGFFAKTNSYRLNFMIVHPSAIVQGVKHVLPKIFSPEVNQDADAWKFQYRIYHFAQVYANKVNGIYVHRAATANATDVAVG